MREETIDLDENNYRNYFKIVKSLLDDDEDEFNIELF